MSSRSSAIDAHKAALEDKRWLTKAMLRLSATVIGLIAMGLFSSAISYENSNFDNLVGNGYWPDGYALAPILLSLLFNPVAFVMHLLFRKSRPIHPAFRMALDLLVFLLAGPAIIVTTGSGLFWLWTSATPNEDGIVDCMNPYNAFSNECLPIAYTIGRIQIAGIVFLVMLFVTHLVLFVFACIDLKQRQLAKRLQAQETFDMAYSKDPERRSQSS